MQFNEKAFMEALKLKNPNENEFIQAVEELVLSLSDFLNTNPIYLEHKVLERLVEPERTIIFRVPWMRDNSEIEVNRGFRVQFSSLIGPYKGGLRFHQSVNLSILKFLGFEQIFKNSLTGLPIGGGKGGSDFDPKGKSDAEIMRFCQSFMSELFRYIGAETDVPAGDIGVGAREIGYLFGQYKKLQNNFSGVLTGKGLDWGGSDIRTEATGYGIIYFLLEMLKVRGDSLADKKVLISGSGNVAQYTAEKAINLGAKVLTMSDSLGTIYKAEGIKIEDLELIKNLKNKIRADLSQLDGQNSFQYLAGKKPWSIQADIALPCATQNEIILDDAKDLKNGGVKMIAEGANMPSELGAVKFFVDNGIIFAPAKAVNAGGVAVSALEMSQNSMGLRFSREQVDEKLKTIMVSIHNKIIEYGKTDQGIDYIKGANIAGFKRVADSMIAQGLV
ncbi:NADP-specific glutamate dehydrogenase [Candidatus Falkowbacteria bacterium]|nr:NADP-specific glutamate dehydrogenase [Candidatus Falkowbacteria bacterium]NCT55181.1 NADP-specific glutamate dehydrogenase [Candidatus Falkowbacteria bacterium]